MAKQFSVLIKPIFFYNKILFKNFVHWGLEWVWGGVIFEYEGRTIFMGKNFFISNHTGTIHQNHSVHGL